MKLAGDIFNTAMGPVLQGLFPNLQAQLLPLPTIKDFDGRMNHYPTYPGSGRVHDGKGSYPQVDIFEGPSQNYPPYRRYPEDRTWGIPKISNTRTMEFRDRNGNGIDDRDEFEIGRLQQIDPIVQDALDRMESERRAGIAGTFVPVQY